MAQVYRLEVALLTVDKWCIQVRIVGATRGSETVRRRPRDTATTDDMELDSDCASDESWVADVLDDSSDDVASLVSSADTGVETEVEACENSVDQAAGGSASGESSEDEEVRRDAERAAAGTFVCWSNGYFTASNNKKWPDVKVRMLPKWATSEHMGTSSMSKTTRGERWLSAEAGLSGELGRENSLPAGLPVRQCLPGSSNISRRRWQAWATVASQAIPAPMSSSSSGRRTLSWTGDVAGSHVPPSSRPLCESMFLCAGMMQ